jgi:hypothetical protein
MIEIDGDLSEKCIEGKARLKIPQAQFASLRRRRKVEALACRF